MQTTSVSHSPKTENETATHTEDEAKLSSTALTESITETTENQTQVEEVK